MITLSAKTFDSAELGSQGSSSAKGLIGMMQRFCDVLTTPSHGITATCPRVDQALTSTYRLGQVATMTGAPRAAILLWEEQYQLISPQRDRFHKRFYTDQEIRHIRNLKTLIIDRGIAPDAVAQCYAVAGPDMIQPMREVLKPRPLSQLLDALQSTISHLTASIQHAATSMVTLRAGIERALTDLSRAFDATNAQCWLVDADAAEELTAIGPALAAQRQRAAARLAQAVFAGQAEEAIAFPRSTDLFIALPISQQGQRFGVLAFERSSRLPVTPEERRVLRLFAAQLALVLALANAHRQSQRLTAVIESLHDGVVIKNPQMMTVFYNQAALKLASNRTAIAEAIAMGIEPPQPHFATSLPGAIPVSAAQLPSHCILNGRESLVNRDMEVCPDPESHPEAIIPIRVTATPFQDQTADQAGVILTIQDVSAIRDAEQHKDEYFRRNVHELRSPMTVQYCAIGVVKHALEKVERHEMPLHQFLAEIKDQLQKLRCANSRMNEMIEDLMNSEMSAGSIQRMSLFECVNSYVNELHESLDPQRIQIDADAADQRLEGYWSRNEIESVVHNLIDNALRYSPEDTRVFIQLYARKQGGHRYAFLLVQDEGYGFPPEDADSIMHKGYRSTSHMPIAIEGTGQGLYFCHEIARKYSGRLTAFSAGPQQGATLTLSLPILDEDAADDGR